MKVLVIRFSSIGDIILCSPILRGLKSQLNAEVHFLSKRKFSDLFQYNPYIDRLFLLDNDLEDTLASLKKEGYDLIIDLHKNLRSKRVKLSLKVPSISYNKENLAKWLVVNTGINYLPKIHLVDRYYQAVSNTGIKNDGQGLEYFYGPAEKNKADGLLVHAQYIGISLGGTYQTKRLPKEKLLQLCRNINQPIILLGGHDVLEESIYIEQNLTSNQKILNLVSKLSLNETAAIVDGLPLLLTYDSALMHLRAAFKKPLMTIWGNTIADFGMFPYFGNFAVYYKQFEVQGLRCRPCSKIGYEKCPKKHFKCMMDLNVSRINDEIHQFYKNL